MELKQVIETKTFEKDGLVVEMNTQMSMGIYSKVKDIVNIDTKDDVELCYIALPSLIIDWNFADDKGEKLPINVDSLKVLPYSIFTWLVSLLVESLASVSELDKKKVSS